MKKIKWGKNHLKQAWPAQQCLCPALQYGSLLHSDRLGLLLYSGQAWPFSPAMLVEMGTLFSAQLSVRLILQQL